MEECRIWLVLLNGLPWLRMIVTLMLVSSGMIERLLRALPRPIQPRAGFLAIYAAVALGRRFEPD